MFPFADTDTNGHVEPDPGPLGLHPPEEGCPEENLHVVSQLLRLKAPQLSPLAAQHARQLSGDQLPPWSNTST